MKNSLLTMGLIACCMFQIGLQSIATAAEPKTDSQSPLRVGVCPVFPPMIYKEGRTLVGVEADCAKALGRALGRQIEFVDLPWEDLINALVEGKVDIIMSSMSRTPARATRIAFCDPYLRIGQMALVRAENQYRYILLEAALAKTTIGLKKGTTADLLVQSEFPRAKRKYFKSGEDAAKALTKKQIDMFISDSTLVSYLAGSYESKSLVKAPMVFSDEVLAWAVRRADEPLRDSVNAFIKKARESGEMTKILERWIPKLE